MIWYRDPRWLLMVAAVVTLTGGTAWGQEGGIEVFAGETLFAEGYRVSLSAITKLKDDLHSGSREISDPLDRTFYEHRVVLGIDYGLHRDVTVSALVPWVYREQRGRTAPGAGKTTQRAQGAGDIALLAKYRPISRFWHLGGFNLAVIGGIETPTGDTGASKNGARLPIQVQPGTGAWNPFLASAAVLDFDRMRFDLKGFYKFNTEGAQDFERGDFSSLEFDAAYRFLHRPYPGATASAGIGLEWRHEKRARKDGSTLSASGSDELMLRPGLTLHPTPAIDIRLSVDVPLYQDYNGQQLGQDLRLFAAFGIRF